MSEVLRIGNCSGFYGDRLSAMREMLDGGPLDVLTGAAGGWLCGAFGVWLSARLRFWEGPGGVRAMATVALATSLALLFVDAGQPDVRLFRIGLAAWGIGGAAAALMQGREDFQS